MNLSESVICPLVFLLFTFWPLRPDIFNPSQDAINAVLLEINGAQPFSSSRFVTNTSNDAFICRLSGGRFVKCGANVSISEAKAMEYVRVNTSIPVPKIYLAFRHDKHSYIVMEFIDAETLDNAQFLLSQDQLYSVAVQLQNIIAQLWKLGGNNVAMGSWPRGPFRNCFFRDSPPVEEFNTMDEFRAYWLGRIAETGLVYESNMVVSMQRFVLTHGDLASRNILVENGHIVAIVDWETFGWYPEFWEYMSAYRGAWHLDWMNALRAAFGDVTAEAMYFGRLVQAAIMTRAS